MTAHTRIGGAWKDVTEIHAKVGGAWKEVTEGHTKIGGVWQQFYASVPPVIPGYDLLETEILASSASSVTFTGLGSYSNYKHLQIRFAGNHTFLTTNLRLRLNSDTGSNYAFHSLNGDGSSVSVFGFSSQSVIFPYPVSPTTTSAVIDILDFDSSSKNTTLRGLIGSDSYMQLFSGLWNNTNAVTDIEVFVASGAFTAGSRFSLYGIGG